MAIMPTRKEACTVAGCFLAVVFCFGHDVSAQPANDNPNLIITLTDDYSAIELDHLTEGFDTLEGAKTPILDKMKNQGVSFGTAWAMPICGPTRGSLMTGLYGQVTGWLSNKKPKNEGLGEIFGTFGNLAQKNGYKTLIAGKWQMVGSVSSYGFDEACLWARPDDTGSGLYNKLYEEYIAGGGFANPTEGAIAGQSSRYWHPFFIRNDTMVETGDLVFGPNVVFDCAKDFINRQKALGNKYMVYMPMLLTHADWDYFRPEEERRISNFIPVPIVNGAGKIVGREPSPGSMKRNIEYQDYLMGTLLDHVRRVGDRKDTVTFFIGDNGSLRYGKAKSTTERATRVPFIVHGPGRVQARRRTNELVGVNDVYATVAGLMNANRNRDIPRPQSVDISPFLLGRKDVSGRAWLYGYLDDPIKTKNNGRWVRDKVFILDGAKDFWRCPTVDERSCVKIRPANATAAEATVREHFEKIICLLEKDLPVDPSRLAQSGDSAMCVLPSDGPLQNQGQLVSL